LSASADSETSYDIKGMFCAFSTSVGVDGDARNDAALEFRILGDGKELWRSIQIQAGQVPVPVLIDITGVRMLSLQVKGPGHGLPLQADWVAPKLEFQP
jgi:alpha-galactosidase